MSNESLKFIDKYEKSYNTALKLEKLIVKYFDQNYGQYLYDIDVQKTSVFMADKDVNKSVKRFKFNFCFDEKVDYLKLDEIKDKIWRDFNTMFDFKLGFWGCPIDVEFYQIKRQRM